MTNPRFPVLALLSVLLAACSTTRNPAPVLDRSTADAAYMSAPAQPRQADPRGYYTVRRGDTLIQIALEFGQGYRDLVAWNNLADPNDIKVGQALRVVPPDNDPQTASVATAPGVETRPLDAPRADSAPAPAVPNKTEPRGEKLPYSEKALADMRKNDAPPAPVKPERPPATASAELPDDEKISWIWPADGKVIAPFGEGRRGIAIGGKMGQPVVAASAGKVLYAGSGIRGYGNLVIVKHTNNLLSAYAHNKTIFVKEDQIVAQGQKIAEMGNSDSDVVKLHFEIRRQGKPVDPSKFLPSR